MEKLKHNLVRILFLSSIIALFLPGLASAATHYVSPTGTASWPSCVNINTPCSLSTANQNAQAGDTVYLRAGTYNTIEPANSGTNGNRITYQNYNNEAASIVGDVLLLDGRYIANDLILYDRQYISVVGFNFLKPVIYNSGHRRRWFHLENADHILLKDCVFKDGDEDFRYGMSKFTDSSYCIFDNCSWDASNTDEESDSQNDLLSVQGNSDYNLWINCHFGNIAHNEVYFETGDANYNVFYRCKFSNKWRHAISPRFGSFIIEKCIFKDIGKECATCPWFHDRCTSNRPVAAFYPMAMQKSIFRENTLYNCDWVINLGSQFDDTKDSWIYHNTVYNADGHGGTHTHRGTLFVSESGGTTIMHDTNIINNIFAESENDRQIEFYNYNDSAYSPVDNVFSHNIVYDKDTNEIRWGTTIGTVEYVENNHADWVAGANIVTNPLFNNPDLANPDFTLQQSSPGIDVGRYMTLTNGAGSNSINFKCDDVYWTFSGPNPPWNIVHPDIQADKIYFQQSDNSWAERTVMNIDYDAKTITLDTPASWNDNIPIYYKKFDGSAPDIGVYEYGTSCTESWNCATWSAWSTCVSSQQSRTRTCADQNNCGTEINKPSETETQSCESLATYGISNFIQLVSDWLKSETNLISDVNNDGVVNTRDLGIMMSNWQ